MSATPALPDLLLVNGKVHTLDRSATIHEAVALSSGRVVAVGSSRDITESAKRGAHIVDLEGRTAVPGLVDAHAHMDREGLKSRLPSLAHARSINDILGIIAHLVEGKNPGEWIVTMPIGQPPHFRDVLASLAERRLPTRWDLDRVAPDNPVYIKSIWGYWAGDGPLVSIANSRALALAGIGRHSISPWEGIEIERDPASAEPTGVFIEHTLAPTVEHTLMRVAPQFTNADRQAGLLDSQRAYHGFGTTSVFEGHGVAEEVLDGYRQLHTAGELTVRSNLVFSPSWGQGRREHMTEWMTTDGSLLRHHGTGDTMLRIAGIFLEEGRSRDADLRASALPQTGWSGMSADCGVPADDILDVLCHAARAKMRVSMLGSAAITLMWAAHRRVPINGLRWIAGHFTTLTDDDIRAAREMGLVLTAHTNAFIANRGAQLLDGIGQSREDEIVPLARLIREGVPIGLGTDNVPISLFHPIWHAVARQERHHGKVIAPNQRLSVTDAFRAATIGGAYASFEESLKGTIEPAKLADVAILSADPWAIPVDEIPSIHAVMTIVGGRIVHDAMHEPLVQA